jgi:predicted amino acid-binding ACT domain protein
MINLHDDTQEHWKEITEIYKEKMDITDAHVQEIFTMMALGKEDMAGIRKHMKNMKNELKEEQKRQENQINRRDQQLANIDKKLDMTLLRLDYKKKADEKRNGKLDKIDEEEDDHEKRIVILETEMDTVKDISSSTLSLLKAIGVGLVLFFITFFIKTFIWGF